MLTFGIFCIFRDAQRREFAMEERQFDRYRTPRQYAAQEGFPLQRLRAMIAQGVVPGFYSGNRFYIDVNAFSAKLNELAARQARF